MKTCASICYKNKSECEEQSCRMWLDYKEDQNCTLIAVKKNGQMTLEEVGKRLDISYVRVKQIEKASLMKLQKVFLKKSN